MTTPAAPFPIFNQYNYGNPLGSGVFDGPVSCTQLSVSGGGTFGGEVNASSMEVEDGIVANSLQCAAISASTSVSTPAFTLPTGAQANYVLESTGTTGASQWATVPAITSMVGTANEVAVNGSYTTAQTTSSVTLSLPQGVGTSSAVTFGSVNSGGSVSCGTNPMTCGALSSTSLTSTGTMSCGTNAMTCGAMSSTSVSTGPLTTNGSTAQVGQFVASGAATMASLNSGTNPMTCGALSSTAVTSSGSMSCSTLVTSGTITSANKIILTTPANGGVQYPYSSNCIGFQWDGSNLDYVIDNILTKPIAAATYGTNTFTAGSSGSPFWTSSWAPNSGSQTFYFVQIGSMVTMSWNTTPASNAAASASAITSNYTIPTAYIPARSQGAFVYNSVNPGTIAYQVGFLNVAGNGTVYFNPVYNSFSGSSSNLILYGGAMTYSLL